MFNTFSYHAQLADLGVTMACNYTNLAMSCSYAAAALAFAVPVALAASARPAAKRALADATAMEAAPYAAYRSGGGHASTHVIIGTPSKA